MIEAFTRHWWVPVVRGVLGILFGVIVYLVPGIALAVLVLMFGAWALIDGIFLVVGSVAGRRFNDNWSFDLIAGLVCIVVGILTFRSPGITTIALVFYIGAWALVKGAFEIGMAVKLRKELHGEWLLVLAGIISVVFAGLLFWNPIPGALALLWLIGFYAIFFGGLSIGFGLRLRSIGRLHQPISPAGTGQPGLV